MSKKKLSIRLFTVVACLITLLVWFRHHFAQQNEAWLDLGEQNALHMFRIVIADVTEEVEKAKLAEIDNVQQSSQVNLTTWKKYFLTASAGNYPFVKSYELNQINRVSVISGLLDGTAELSQLRVWIPHQTVSESNYVAAASFQSKLGTHRRKTILLYTPSIAERFYIARVDPDSQGWAMLEKEIESYNWKEPFPIAPETWKESHEFWQQQ